MMETNLGNNAKVYVAVNARFSPDGRLVPLSVTWEDGREFPIDRVTDVCRRASMRAGGSGIRYTVEIGKKTTYLYLEEDKWFVERVARKRPAPHRGAGGSRGIGKAPRALPMARM